ncbi:L-serine ammonia-lyase [bacterium]|nr:L-serine ammonia-lyase [bacterium]
MLSIKEIYKIGFGPSSSHTIGPVKASEIFKERNPDAKSFKVQLYGSLALTGVGHHTDVAIQKTLLPQNTEIIWKEKETLPLHPNGMIFKAFDSEEKSIDTWTVYSIGGGDLRDDSGILNNKQVYKSQSLTDILEYCLDEGKTFWEYVEDNEDDDIWKYLKNVWDVMKESITRGLEDEGVLPGTLKLPRKAHRYFIKAINSRKSIQNMGLLYSFALAVSEENADYGKIVTAPTCGSAGVLPASLFYLLRDEYIKEQHILKALATAGLIGNIVKSCASISGAEVGCQGEIGTACAMAAGAASQLLGGSIHQIEYAAEMGFEHNLGLTCDPVSGYVQIPCIERNAIAAAKAIECAVYTSLSDGAHKISFDRTVNVMAETGHDMQSAYRETSIGGLAKKWVKFK